MSYPRQKFALITFGLFLLIAGHLFGTYTSNDAAHADESEHASNPQQTCTFVTPAPYQYPMISIDSPGLYCLDTDIDVPPNIPFGKSIIEIRASDVIFDLRGFVINAGDATWAIQVRPESTNWTIRNGTIRDSRTAINVMQGAQNGTMELVRVLTDGMGINFLGTKATIRYCDILSNTRSIHIEGAPISNQADNFHPAI